MNATLKSFHPSDEAVAGMYAAGRLASRTLDEVDKMLAEDPYRTTEEIDRMCDEFIRSHGGFPECVGYKSSMSPVPYQYATCISVNDAACHGLPSEYRLKDGDVLNVDLVVRYPANDYDNSWLGDTSRSYGIGKISDEDRNLLRIAKNAMYAGMKVVRKGAEFHHIGMAIQKYVESTKLNVQILPDFIGHGISKTMHEGPSVEHKRNVVNPCKIEIIPGISFTIEPIIVLGNSTKWYCDKDHWTIRMQSKRNALQFEHTMSLSKTGKLMIFTTTDDAHEQRVLDEIKNLVI